MLSQINAAIQAGRVRVTSHAREEARADSLTFESVCHSVLIGVVIREYLDDKPYPSCLVYGQTATGEPIHSVWAYNERSDAAVLITVYRPDPARWIDWRVRKEPS